MVSYVGNLDTQNVLAYIVQWSIMRFMEMDLSREIDETLATRRPHAPTMGALDKVRYTHTDMIDFIIANPWVSQNELAARYGYSPGWVSNIMASDAWQAAMASRRDEVVNPELKATLDERFRGITLLSLQKLQQKLEAPQVSDQVVLRAVELGAKACGIGGNRAPAAEVSQTVINLFSPERLAAYANGKLQQIENEAIEGNYERAQAVQGT